jgi:hypothetical protein
MVFETGFMICAGVVIGVATARIFNRELEKVAERMVDRWMESK